MKRCIFKEVIFMKDAFKKGFGAFMGIYCGAVVVGTIGKLLYSNENEEMNDTEKNGVNEEESK
jgi:hypothetical protein